MTTIIQLEDYYAPTFPVPVRPAEQCQARLQRQRPHYSPLFHTTHPEPWRPSNFHPQRRRSRFAALSKA